MINNSGDKDDESGDNDYVILEDSRSGEDKGGLEEAGREDETGEDKRPEDEAGV